MKKSLQISDFLHMLNRYNSPHKFLIYIYTHTHTYILRISDESRAGKGTFYAFLLLKIPSKSYHNDESFIFHFVQTATET